MAESRRIGVYLDGFESKIPRKRLQGGDDVDESGKEPNGEKGIIDEI